MSEWINAKIQVPDASGSCFARCYGHIFVGQYDKKLNKWKDPNSTSGMDQEVSHWMSIPPFKDRLEN